MKEKEIDKTDWEMTIRQWLKLIFTGSNKAVKRKWDIK